MYHPLSRVLYVYSTACIRAVGIAQLAECRLVLENLRILFRTPTHKPVLVAHIFNLSGNKVRKKLNYW